MNTSPPTPVKCRDFMKTAATAGAGMFILPTGSLFGGNTPNSKLNIAQIGCYGPARAGH